MEHRKRAILQTGRNTDFWGYVSGYIQARMDQVQRQLMALDTSDPQFHNRYSELRGALSELQAVLHYPQSADAYNAAPDPAGASENT